VDAVEVFWEEHLEKSKEDYDPYNYVWDMDEDNDVLIDFEWEDEGDVNPQNNF
jgi:hypothetical protein